MKLDYTDEVLKRKINNCSKKAERFASYDRNKAKYYNDKAWVYWCELDRRPREPCVLMVLDTEEALNAKN